MFSWRKAIIATITFTGLTVTILLLAFFNSIQQQDHPSQDYLVPRGVEFGCIVDDLQITTNTTWSTDQCYGNVTITNGATLTIAGNTTHELNNLTLGDGTTNGFVSVQSDTTLGVGAEIQSNNITINTGSYISANGLGYGTNSGPGAGVSSGYQGGTHAGVGTANSDNTYGSISEPITLGSGARNTAGGGAIKLTISETFNNNGSVSANGNNLGSCPNAVSAGAGGSVWINFTGETSTFTGTGSISAVGGTSTGGSYSFCSKGGGGRVAITGFANYIHSGTISANGGGSSNYGNAGAGTIYTRSASDSFGLLRISNSSVSGNTPLTTSELALVDEIEIANAARLYVGPGSVLETPDNFTITTETNGNVYVEDGGSLTAGVGSTVNLTATGTINNFGTLDISDADDLEIYGTFISNSSASTSFPANVTVKANGLITHPATQSLALSFESLSIESGGRIDATSRGYATNSGPGAGGYYIGATHAGYGSANTQETYGSVDQPTTLGSGAYTTAGGGAIKLSIENSLVNEGTITANGGNVGSCPSGTATGAGGSVWLDFKGQGTTFSGTGSISANGGIATGGSSSFCRRGSGGRIAITDLETDSFSGTITANGGGNSNSGAAGTGTIYERTHGETLGKLTLKNSTTSGNTPLTTNDVANVNELIIDTNAIALIPAGSDLSSQAGTSVTLNGMLVVSSGSTFTINDDGELISSSNSTISNNGLVSISSDNNVTLGSVNNSGQFNVLNALSTSIDGTFSVTNTSTTSLGSNVVINSTGTITTAASQPAEISFENLTINSGGKIDVSSQGFSAGQGPGASTQWVGASHGGQGQAGGYVGSPGSSWRPTYGSITEPASLGSGGTSVPGGGAIKLNISGNLTNNGFITADGAGYFSGNNQGSGAGGSIWINFTGENSTLEGQGRISASGGSSNYVNFGNNIHFYGGGGGRIAIKGFSSNDFEGIITASGRSGGAAGTVYLENDETKSLRISNQFDLSTSHAPYNAFTPIPTDIELDELIVSNYGTPHILSETTLSPSPNSTISLGAGTNTLISGSLILTDSTLNFDAGATLQNSGTFNSQSSNVTVNGTYISNSSTAINNLGNVTVGSTGTITTAASQPAEISFENLTINSGGKIDVSSKGYAGGLGPGAALQNYYGASHGGQGNGGTIPYGSMSEPVEMGSGGFGSTAAYGGGAIKLNISGNLTNNGFIAANATAYGDAYKGSGSGGSIWINFTGENSQWNGNGYIAANGGSSPYFSGGGGRIAVKGFSSDNHSGYEAAAAITNNYSYATGGAGTIFTQQKDQTKGTLTVSNFSDATNSKPATNRYTYLNQEEFILIENLRVIGKATFLIPTDQTAALQASSNVFVSEASTLINDGSLELLNSDLTLSGTYISNSSTAINNLGNVTVGSTGTITTAASQPAEISFENLTINSGGKIDVSSKGYAGFEGPGAVDDNYAGASHGGSGHDITESDPYGSITEPVTMGSGGFASTSAYGGGAIKLNISGDLTNNGFIAANATAAGDAYKGSGSGGSIWINFTGENSQWNGNGYIAANGGATNWYTGSGGRVAITGYSDDNSTGYVAAAPVTTGSYPHGSSAGTIYTRSASQEGGTLKISNKPDGINSRPSTYGDTPINEDLVLDHMIIEHHTDVILNNDLVVSETMEVDGILRFGGTNQKHLGNVIIGSTGVITHLANTTTHQNNVNIYAQTLSVETGGTITANSLGYSGGTTQNNGQGPGAGNGTSSGGAGGAGYGGEGNNGTGANGGSIYGSATNPSDLGSGGGGGQNGAGGAGGGLITLEVNDQLNLSGTITANGANGSSTGGGGSGGSINIRAEEFNCTSGSISANGGAGGANAGQGGGGRVAYLVSEYSACSSISVSGAQNGTINDVVVVETPTGLHASNVTHNSITWTWTDNSDNETSFKIYDTQGNVRGTKSSTTSEEIGQLISYTETGLTPNSLYSRRVASVSGSDVGLKSSSVLVQTRAQTPSAPNASVLSPFEIQLRVGSDNNPSYTQYAIALHGPETFVQADGTLSVEPLWQTKAQWNENNGVIVGNLDPNTTYSFKIKARSNDYVETIYSVRATTTYAPAPPPPIVEPEQTTATISVPNSGGGSGGSGGSGWAFRCNSNLYVQVNGTCGETKVFHPTPEIVVSDLIPGTTYTFEVVTINHEGVETEFSEPVTIVTLAVEPNDPQLSVLSHNSGRIKLSSDINPSHTAYAIREATTNKFLQGNGTLGNNPAWHTKTQWQYHLDGYDITGLTPNTLYSFSVVARNATNINTAHTQLQNIRTFAATPPRPDSQDRRLDGFTALINPGTNPASTQYIIEIDGLYVQSDGTLHSEPTWQTYEEWGATEGIEIIGLEEDTTYELSTKARNNDEIETDNSESEFVTTLWSGPLPPTAIPTSDSSINVTINNENYDETYEFMIVELTTSNYVASNGELSSEQVWQTYENWGGENGIEVASLQSNTQYTFATIARDTNQIQDLQSNEASTWTFASTPLQPQATEISYTSFIAWMTVDNNPNHTRYSLKVNNQYINLNGEATPEAFWATLNQWNETGTIISSLNQDTSYTLVTQAINEDNQVTNDSPELQISTLKEETPTQNNPPTTTPEISPPTEETPPSTTTPTTQPTPGPEPETEDETPEVKGKLEVNPEIEPSMPIVIGRHSATGAFILNTIYTAMILALMGATLLLMSRIKSKEIKFD